MHSSFKNSSYNGVRKHFMLRNSLHFPTFRKSYRCLRTPIRTSSRSFKNPLKIGTRSAAVNWSPRITASSWMEKARVRRTFHCKQANKGTTWGTVTKTNKLLNNPCVRIETTGQTGLVESVNHINCKSDLNLQFYIFRAYFFPCKKLHDLKTSVQQTEQTTLTILIYGYKTFFFPYLYIWSQCLIGVFEAVPVLPAQSQGHAGQAVSAVLGNLSVNSLGPSRVRHGQVLVQ